MANSVPLSGTYAPTSIPLGTGTFQSAGGGLQGSTNTTAVTQPKADTAGLQVAPSPQSVNASPGVVAGASTAIDPAVTTANADAAKSAALRGHITDLVNSVKNVFNSRYGQVDQSAKEQVGKLNDRFGNESGDLADQIDSENQQVGASFAGKGTYDSSYRGNNVDTVTKAGASQIRDLGTELQDNIGKIAAWVAQQKTGYDAQKGGLDAVLSHLAEETDPANLTTIRNTLESKLAEIHAGGADNNTEAQNVSALDAIAPSSPRSVQLKTTLGQIVAGNADSTQKAAIGQRLIQSAGLTPEEQQNLSQAFQLDLSTRQKQPTA